MKCKLHCAPRTCHTHKHFLACGSSMQGSRAHFMSHAQRSWLDRISCPPPHSTPSLLYPPNRSIPCISPQGVPFGRLAEQSPVTGYEPNEPVEVGSTEVTTLLLPSRRASIGSTATTPASSEVDERPNLGMLASALSTQKRGASATAFRIYHSDRENSESRSSDVAASAGRPVSMY